MEEKDMGQQTLNVPVPVRAPAALTEVMTGEYTGIATLVLTPEQTAVLSEPIPLEDLDILPTGEVFASQVRYRRILNHAFGPGGWALRPRSGWVRQDTVLCREYALFVQGKFVSEAIGECEYQENNPRMTWPTATEAVKSNALVRACKDLGIASECWDRHFCDRFQAEQCVRAIVTEKGQQKVRWRRKDGRPLYGEVRVAEREPGDDDEAPQPPLAGPTPRVIAPETKITEPQQKRLFAIAKFEGHHTEEAIKKWLKDEHGVDSTKDIKRGQYDGVIERLRQATPLNQYDAD